MIEQVLIENYKSIKDLSLPLNRLNVLNGSNGAGKSNFFSFFELTKAIYEQRFGSYTLSKGGGLITCCVREEKYRRLSRD